MPLKTLKKKKKQHTKKACCILNQFFFCFKMAFSFFASHFSQFSAENPAARAAQRAHVTDGCARAKLWAEALALQLGQVGRLPGRSWGWGRWTRAGGPPPRAGLGQVGLLRQVSVPDRLSPDPLGERGAHLVHTGLQVSLPRGPLWGCREGQEGSEPSWCPPCPR